MTESFKVVPIMYERTLGSVYDLKNMDTLGDLLSNGWRVVRVDVLPGAVADPPLPPALVYVLARDEPAASDDDAAVERAAVAMFRLDTNRASRRWNRRARPPKAWRRNQGNRRRRYGSLLTTATRRLGPRCAY